MFRPITRPAAAVLSLAVVLAGCGSGDGTKTVTQTVVETVTVGEGEVPAPAPTTTTGAPAGGTKTTAAPATGDCGEDCLPGGKVAIHVNTGILGANLGMTRAQVTAMFGTPDRSTPQSSELGTYTKLTFHTGLEVTVDASSRVVQLDTQNPAHRTTQLIGVGSTKAQVRARHKRADCSFGSVCTIPGAGNRQTDFHLRNGKVWRVTVGIVQD